MSEIPRLQASSPTTASRRTDWSMFGIPAVIVLHAIVLGVLYSRPGPWGVLLWHLGPFLLRVLAVLLLIAAVIWSLVRRPFWNRRRAAAYFLFVVLIWLPFLYRTYPSSHDGKPSQVRFRLPLDGPITIAWGGREPGHHGAAPDQRWAYDMLVTQDGRSFRGDGAKLEDYHCYGLPLVAPADGQVVDMHEGDPDVPIGQMGGGTSAAGNHVVIEVAPHEFLFICHMQPGSIKVKKGDRVSAGQAIGRVGNSGNTSEPHIHVHLQDTPRLHFGEGIPLHFSSYRSGDRLVERGMPNGGVRFGKLAGEIVDHVSEQSGNP